MVNKKKKGGDIMRRTFKVKNFKDVKTDRYIEGDIFFNNKQAGILVEGKIMNIKGTPNMRDYVKKTDVEKMINDAIKGGEKT